MQTILRTFYKATLVLNYFLVLLSIYFSETTQFAQPFLNLDKFYVVILIISCHVNLKLVFISSSLLFLEDDEKVNYWDHDLWWIQWFEWEWLPHRSLNLHVFFPHLMDFLEEGCRWGWALRLEKLMLGSHSPSPPPPTLGTPSTNSL